MPCSYCDVSGHGRDEYPERLEDKFGTEPAHLREGETRDDDSHADVVAAQLAEADEETLEEIEDEEREIRCDGGTRTQSDRLAGWNPNAAAETAPRCQNCGTQHTKQFARVFGDNRDVIHACPDCETYREMQTAAVPEDSEDQ